jgi:hypothetical protein
MKKICIETKNEGIALIAEALKIKNTFMLLGFDRRNSFREVVQDHCPKYKDYHFAEKLNVFWSVRCIDQDLNNELLNVLEQLKNE